jgi:hypothetical protein
MEDDKLDDNAGQPQDPLLRSQPAVPPPSPPEGPVRSSPSETSPGVTGATNNQKPSTENMEVHHHSHSHGTKDWRSYTWEFLMLFLAVFCGFLAEYKLEHVIEHQKEKQYVRSLMEDLKSDQQLIEAHIVSVTESALLMDTLVSILNNPSDIKGKTGDLYYLVRLAPRLNPMTTNSRTFDQLKNSGNFRLISNLNTSNKIMAYYEKLPLIRLLENINETEFTEYKKVAAKIFSPAVFRAMEGDNDTILRGADNPPLRTADIELFQELSVYAVYLHGTKKGIVANAEEIKTSGAALLKYLEDEYHFEN